MLKDLTWFACITEYKETGRTLNILGNIYEAHYYDTYIFDAITIVGRWPRKDVTYQRICHLRYWIRENIQHGHDLPYRGIRSVKGAKEFIQKLIRLEYPDYLMGEIPEFKVLKEEAEYDNQKIFNKN